MQKMWVSSVVAGLLVLAPIAAVAQTGGDEAEELEQVETEVATEETQEVTDEELDEETGEETETLELVDETETNDPEDPSGESNDHGERVSTVAQCAPTGKLDIDGFKNHGAFVSAAAKGEEITVEGNTFDLSTAVGVEDLCTWAEGYEPTADAVSEEDEEVTLRSESTEASGGQGKPAHAGKPDHAGKNDVAAGNGGGKGKGNKRGR